MISGIGLAGVHWVQERQPLIGKAMKLSKHTYPNARSSTPMDLFSLSPLAAFESEFDRLFETAARDFHLPREASGRFLIDLYEDNDNSYVRAELPGVTRDQIN